MAAVSDDIFAATRDEITRTRLPDANKAFLNEVLNRVSGMGREQASLMNLYELMGDDFDPQMLGSVLLLANIRTPVMDPCGYLVENGRRVRFTSGQVNEAMSGRDVTHPETGEVIPRAMERLILAFSLRDEYLARLDNAAPTP